MPLDTTVDVWAEAADVGDALRRTLDDAEGFDSALELLREGRRVVATGNGAAYYVALAMDLAAHETPAAPDIRAVPAGLLSSGRFVWRDGDVLIAISSSGKQRDVLEALDHGAPRPYVTVTSNPDAPLGAGAAAAAIVHVDRQEVVTHTQGYVGNAVTVLALLARLAGDHALERAVDDAPDAYTEAFGSAAPWVDEMIDADAVPTAVVAFGTGTAWAAALEAALLVKEVSGLPAEGLETREGGTSGMYALTDTHVVLSLPTANDPHAREAEQVCASMSARVLRVPGGDRHDARLAPVTTFPTALAVAIALGQSRGLDVDAPSWTQAYYKTAHGSADRGV